MSSFRECCTAKYPLRPNDSAAYLVRRSNAAPGRAVCFLGRFLPKLGGATSTAIFLRPRSGSPDPVQRSANVPAARARPATNRVMAAWTAAKSGSRSIRLSSI
jgi:hypothetical protein